LPESKERNMSRASKLTLAGTSLVAAGIVYFVHWAQEAEKAVRPTRVSSSNHHSVVFLIQSHCVN
jgi:hypothetical protein